jgi:hypothetical protein
MNITRSFIRQLRLRKSIIQNFFLQNLIFQEPLKKLLSRITDDIFYKDKIDYDKILTKLGLIVAKEIDLEILLTQVTQGLLNELKLKRVDLILHLENNFYTLNSSGLTQVQVNSDVVTYLKTNNEITILEELRRKAYDMPEGIARKQLESIAAVFEQMKWEMVAPVIIEKELSAIIGLDSKLSGDIYNKDDVNFFTILAPQIAVAIEKSKLYEEVDKFNAQLQEKIDRATKKLRQVNLDLESRNKFLTTTQNISNLISRSLDINHIIQIIADSIASELGYIGGLLSFVGPQGKYLYPAAITRSPTRLRTPRLGMHRAARSASPGQSSKQDPQGLPQKTTGRTTRAPCCAPAALPKVCAPSIRPQSADCSLPKRPATCRAHTRQPSIWATPRCCRPARLTTC